MVLVADIAGDDADLVAAATSEVVRLANLRNGEGLLLLVQRQEKNSGKTENVPQPLVGTPTLSK